MPSITVDQAKLVMNTFAAIFQNNLISSDFVTWKQYDTEMNDRNGLTVVEQVGPRYAVTRTTNGVQDLTTGVQDTVFGSEQYKVNTVFGSSMGWGDFVKIRDIGDARESTAISNAATNLAEQIDAYILNYAVLASNNWVGTAGNAVALYGDVASAYTRLKEEGVEDADLRAVLTYADKQALGSDIVTNRPALDQIGSGIYRKGFDGEVAGIPTAFTQQLPTMTLGTRTNGLVNGAAQNVNYKAVSVSGAPGQYLSQTIAADGFGANATIKDGEVFTIAGVFAYDNRLQASLGRLQQFRVIGDTTADGTGAVAALRIFPAIIPPGSGSGGDINVNTANATVTAAPADNAAVTFIGTASTAYKPRALLNKNAIIVNTADLIMPATGIAERKQLSKVPLSIRMWKNSNFNTGEHDVRFDVALTANVRDRRRVVRVNGA
jgi:hypothetical protein